MFILLNKKVQKVKLENIRKISEKLYRVNVRPDKMDGNYMMLTLGTDIFFTEAEAQHRL